MKDQNDQSIEVHNENLEAPKVSKYKDEYQKDEYPVEIKPNEQSHSDESDDINDSSIQFASRVY